MRSCLRPQQFDKLAEKPLIEPPVSGQEPFGMHAAADHLEKLAENTAEQNPPLDVDRPDQLGTCC